MGNRVLGSLQRGWVGSASHLGSAVGFASGVAKRAESKTSLATSE